VGAGVKLRDKPQMIQVGPGGNRYLRGGGGEAKPPATLKCKNCNEMFI